jgi:protein O-GlcNAc transferase
LKIGFISTFFINHTIGHLNKGIIENLDRDRFEVVVFRPTGIQDEFSRSIDLAADRVIPIEKDLQKARTIIAEQKLDVLFYTDIGMDPFTYFLAFYRLAPVQCVTLGHPVTTGIPNMDYYISSENSELPEAQEHYSEQLYLMKKLPCFYDQPKLSTKKIVRADFGLPLQGNIYLCPQSLFKLHPSFDETIMDLLNKDRHGWLVLIEGKHSYLTEQLRQRWSKLSINRSERILFISRMDENKFIDLLQLADVVLDPFHFSGGKTSAEALSVSAPIVTLPGAFMRSRLTLACYRLMGVMDLVAENSEQYVTLAVRLTTDPAWRDEIVAKIQERSHLISEDIEVVRELEVFFETAVAKTYL